MSFSRSYISAFTVLVAQSLAAATAFASPVLSFNDSTGGGALHGNRTLGWRFNVLQPITVDGLGWFDQSGDGLILGHRIGIWSPAGVLLTDATVPAGSVAPLDGQFRSISVSSILLSPGIGYIVSGEDFAADTERLACGNTVPSPCNGLVPNGGTPQLSQTIDPRIQWTGAMYSDPTTNFIRPALVGVSTQGYYGPGFSVQLVPEPSTLVLAMLVWPLFWRRYR